MSYFMKTEDIFPATRSLQSPKNKAWNNRAEQKVEQIVGKSGV